MASDAELQSALKRLQSVWHTNLPRGLFRLADAGAAAMAGYGPLPAATPLRAAGSGTERHGGAPSGSGGSCSSGSGQPSIVDLFQMRPVADADAAAADGATSDEADAPAGGRLSGSRAATAPSAWTLGRALEVGSSSVAPTLVLHPCCTAE